MPKLSAVPLVEDAKDPGPTLNSVAPDWAELTRKLVEFEERRAALISEIAPLQKLVGKNAQWSQSNPPSQRPKPRLVETSPAAGTLLGKEFTPAPRYETTGARPPPGVAELEEISRGIQAIDEAIALLRPQLVRAHSEGSKRLWKALGPEYRGITDRICAALIELGRAHVEHDQFLHKHRSAAKAQLRPVHGTGTLGDPRDPQSELRRLLEWAVEAGHFDRANIPTTEWKRPSSENSFSAAYSR